MQDREKVIRGLECLITNEVDCDGCQYNEGENSSCLRNIAKDALGLLKLQEPARAIREFSDDFSYDGGSWWYECGNCQNPVDYHDVFCSYCGKRLKWDD